LVEFFELADLRAENPLLGRLGDDEHNGLAAQRFEAFAFGTGGEPDEIGGGAYDFGRREQREKQGQGKNEDAHRDGTR
jgi:hypothetical protein